MNNSITLTCIPVPWMDVNTLCSYTTQRDNKTGTYLIKSLNFGLAPDDSMTVKMIQVYE